MGVCLTLDALQLLGLQLLVSPLHVSNVAERWCEGPVLFFRPHTMDGRKPQMQFTVLCLVLVHSLSGRILGCGLYLSLYAGLYGYRPVIAAACIKLEGYVQFDSSCSIV